MYINKMSESGSTSLTWRPSRKPKFVLSDNTGWSTTVTNTADGAADIKDRLQDNANVIKKSLVYQLNRPTNISLAQRMALISHGIKIVRLKDNVVLFPQQIN